MLDQSFSAHNIETIYCLESRKGNIDIHTMPYEYQEIIANSEQLKKIISDLKYKKGKETRDITEIEQKKVDLIAFFGYNTLA